jgi:mannose-1-phosphate guanylyltransferase
LNIILLSGGSGKRLWPLSNEVRSKQFIKLFKHGGDRESMLERVYRQIKTVDSSATVTIATSKTQVAAIHNQLGENVSVCVEPMRRDTFPAIALASAFLHDVENVPLDESVVVCPVDPYVDDSYYEAVQTLGEMAGKTNLTLMGIEPSYASEKYGYIIPEITDKVSDVKEFKEKPDKATAEKYLKQGALWNAGVFAFKLSYLLDKAHELINFSDYHDLFDHYDACPKISFDYAVVEKEKSISVLRYKGTWKDVGTWNTMSEVMADNVIGDATLDDTTTNTNIVNELDIPILVMGAHDMIVAASGDGILVSNKEQSGYMKPYVDKISTDVHYADKSWGTYQVIDADNNSRTIKVTLKSGNRMSYHSHDRRDEVWTVISGTGRTIVDGMEQHVKVGDVITMQAGCRHTVIADTDLQMIEIQLGKDISVSDKNKYKLDE